MSPDESFQVEGNATLIVLILSTLFAPCINSGLVNMLINKRYQPDVFTLEFMINCIPGDKKPRTK